MWPSWFWWHTTTKTTFIICIPKAAYWPTDQVAFGNRWSLGRFCKVVCLGAASWGWGLARHVKGWVRGIWVPLHGFDAGFKLLQYMPLFLVRVILGENWLNVVHLLYGRNFIWNLNATALKNKLSPIGCLGEAFSRSLLLDTSFLPSILPFFLPLFFPTDFISP